MVLKVGDRVKPNKKKGYWNSDSRYPLRNNIFIVKKIEYNIYENSGNNFIYFHPDYDWNCYESDLIKILDEWDE